MFCCLPKIWSIIWRSWRWNLQNGSRCCSCRSLNLGLTIKTNVMILICIFHNDQWTILFVNIVFADRAWNKDHHKYPLTSIPNSRAIALFVGSEMSLERRMLINLRDPKSLGSNSSGSNRSRIARSTNLDLKFGLTVLFNSCIVLTCNENVRFACIKFCELPFTYVSNSKS